MPSSCHHPWCARNPLTSPLASFHSHHRGCRHCSHVAVCALCWAGPFLQRSSGRAAPSVPFAAHRRSTYICRLMLDTGSEGSAVQSGGVRRGFGLHPVPHRRRVLVRAAPGKEHVFATEYRVGSLAGSPSLGAAPLIQAIDSYGDDAWRPSLAQEHYTQTSSRPRTRGATLPV